MQQTIFFFVVLLLTTTFVVAGEPTKEPSYKGKSVSAWIAKFQDKAASDRDREDAIYALGDMASTQSPSKLALQALTQALGDTKFGFMAADYLGYSEEHGVSILAHALKDKDPLVRRAVAQSLGNSLQSVAAQQGVVAREKIVLRRVSILANALKDEDPSVRSVTAQYLGSSLQFMAEPEKIVLLLAEALLKDKNADVRRAAAQSLQQSGKLWMPTLITAAKSGEVNVRKLAVNAIGQIAPRYARKAVPDLIALLKEKDEDLRCEVAMTLGQMGNEAGEALPALLTASKVADDAGKAARDALQRISKAPRSSAPALLTFLKDPEPLIRFKAVEALCDLEEGDKECLATLLELVKRRDAKLRLRAGLLLARYGSAAKDAVPALIEIVRNDGDRGAREVAIYALGAIGPEAKAAIPALKAAQQEVYLEIYVKQALKKIEQ